MDIRRLVWLAVPLLGLAELALHAYFARRAPGAAEWALLEAAVSRAARPGDLVVVAPAWAEPLARKALGERWMPLADVARADVESRETALEVSLLGAEATELAGFRETSRSEAGGFLLRRLTNPAYVPALYRFVEHVRPDALRVFEEHASDERPCEFSAAARPSTGGLPGHVAYPRARFRCSGGEPFFVGVTVIDDQRYRPRRCIFAHPLAEGVLGLEFRDVPVGRVLVGYTGASYLIARDGVGAPVELRALVDGREVGKALQRDERGFERFEFALPEPRSERALVRFEVRSADPEGREFCFVAEMR